MAEQEKSDFRSLLVDLVREGGSLATRVCRVCLRRADDLVRLSDTCSVQISPCAGTYTLAEILSHVTRTKIEEERVLPRGVCAACVQSCVEAYILMRTYELNTRALERVVDLMSYRTDTELAPAQDRLVLSVLPTLHDHSLLDHLNIHSTHLDMAEGAVEEVCWAKLLKPEMAKFECSMCERSFASRLLLRQHETVHPPLSDHICRICGNGYKQKRVLSRHMAERHGGGGGRKRLLCVLCAKLFPSTYTLFCHQVVVHGATKLYYCSSCRQRSRSEAAMLRHMRTHHANDPDAHYSVLEPNDELRARLDSTLAYPQQQLTEATDGQMDAEGAEEGRRTCAVSSSSRTYTCNTCVKTFPRASALRRHTDREHRHMECRQCRKVFRIRTRYEMHMRLHAANPDLKVFKCDYCDYSAKQRRHLVQHTTRRHTDIRPFSCHVCGKGFVKHGEVRSHMVVHTRERPELCALCDKRFVNKAALLYHTRLHTGEKPYACEQCGERFLSASRRGAHVRSKHGPRPQCSICNSTYTNNQVLQKHIRNVHMKGALSSGYKTVRVRKIVKTLEVAAAEPVEDTGEDATGVETELPAYQHVW